MRYKAQCAAYRLPAVLRIGPNALPEIVPPFGF
jgi:hypothetical protein